MFPPHFVITLHALHITSDLLFPNGRAEYEITAIRFTGIKYTHPVCAFTMNRRCVSKSQIALKNSQQCYLGSRLGTCLSQLLLSIMAFLLLSDRSASVQDQVDRWQLALYLQSRRETAARI